MKSLISSEIFYQNPYFLMKRLVLGKFLIKKIVYHDPDDGDDILLFENFPTLLL